MAILCRAAKNSLRGTSRKLRFFLVFLLVDGRIRSRSQIRIRIHTNKLRIQEAKNIQILGIWMRARIQNTVDTVDNYLDITHNLQMFPLVSTNCYINKKGKKLFPSFISCRWCAGSRDDS